MKAVPLSEVCRIVNGGTPKSGIADYWEGDVAWLTPAEMGKLKSPSIGQTARTITQAGLRNSSARQVPVGAVIMSTRAPIGHLAIPKVPMAFNQGCRGLVPNERLDTKYLYYFLFFSRGALNELGTGATFKELASSALGKFHIPLPPLEKQRRVVAVLDEAFAAIATAAANAEKNLANATLSYEASLESYVTDALSSFGSTTLGAKTTHITDGDHSPPPKTYAGIPFVTISNINKRSGTISFADTFFVPESYYRALKLSRKPEAGNLLYTVTGATLGVPSLVDHNREFCFQRHIAIIKPDSHTSSEWLLHILRSSNVFSQASLGSTGAAQKTVSLATLRGIKIPNSDGPDQEAAASRFSAIFQAADDLIRIYEAKLGRLRELKQSLLHRAFTGKLTEALVSATNDNLKTPAFTAQVIALAYRYHVALGTEATFGRVKAQKALHLCESVGGIDLGRKPIKDAAGPNDFQHMLAAEDWAKANQFFEFVPRPSGNGYSFKKLARFNTAVAEGAETLQPVKGRLEKAISLVAPMNSEQAELLATVHAAWNNLLLDGVEATEAAIINEARDNWHVSKQKFDDSRFRQAIATIQAKGIEPDGSAKRVGGQEALLF